MTNKDAIAILENIKITTLKMYPEECDALDKAIESLKREFSANIGDTVFEIAFPLSLNGKPSPIIIPHVVTGIERTYKGLKVDTVYRSDSGREIKEHFYLNYEYLYNTLEEAQKKLDVILNEL